MIKPFLDYGAYPNVSWRDYDYGKKAYQTYIPLSKARKIKAFDIVKLLKEKGALE